MGGPAQWQSEIQIVGASAWNRPCITPKKPSTPVSGEATLASEVSIPKSVDFLIVAYSGTHVRCSAPTPADKDEWLAALHAGLESNILENRAETLLVLSKKYDDDDNALCQQRARHSYRPAEEDGASAEADRRRCRELRSCVLSDMMVQSSVASALEAYESEDSFRPLLPPLPRAVDKAKCVSDNYDPTMSVTTGYHSPCDDWSYYPPSEDHCTACGRYPPAHALKNDAAPLPEYGMEVRADLCHDCLVAQGVLRHVRYLGWLYEIESRDRAAIRTAWDNVREVLDQLEWENAGMKRADAGDQSIQALLELVATEGFSSLRERSATLDSLCEVLERRGLGHASDFLHSLEECARAAESACFHGEKGEAPRAADDNSNDARLKERVSMKKEAFKVAGDMSAALKLLYEYALPPDHRNAPSKAQSSRSYENADMLAAILEFFLDLCDEGQIDAVAFFWPQLCTIHMQMLPPRDTEEMIRVELMEDFLLTVATRYSVHLALDLVWGLTADLEESLGSSNCNSLSRRRRFAVLRFVSELESLLFDFEGGWGGGRLSLQGMLSPSQHQAALLRDAMSLLQLRRKFGSHYLTRSVRLDKLRSEALEPLGVPSFKSDDSDVKAQIAKNAAYFSSHIAFARKLGNIAEKLRFTRVENRQEALREELKELNASGKILGGDPLNRLCRDGQFQRAVNIPINEGHVFRSKERTPVLLLAEIVEDTAEVAYSSKLTSQHHQHHITGADRKSVEEVNGDIIVSHELKKGRTHTADAEKTTCGDGRSTPPVDSPSSCTGTTTSSSNKDSSLNEDDDDTASVPESEQCEYRIDCTSYPISSIILTHSFFIYYFISQYHTASLPLRPGRLRLTT